MNKYLALIIAVLSSAELQAQAYRSVPKLVVDITIDQLRSDLLEQFAPLFSADGFKKLSAEATVYETGNYSFAPLDRCSAIASIATGTTPYYNNIVGTKWLDRSTLRPTGCVDDTKYVYAPTRLGVSTVGDELKVFTNGSALVYSIAPTKEEAILAGGHAANGAFWRNEKRKKWETSTYYAQAAQLWVNSYSSLATTNARTETVNDEVCKIALACINTNAMGKDNITDMLSLSLTAAGNESMPNWQQDLEAVYRNLDKNLSTLISEIERQVGKDNVLFVITSTGCADESNIDYNAYNIPTGTFYINRTANLLNMYLGAIYGQGRYVDACFGREIYLNRKLIESKHLGMSELLERAQDFLFESEGVKDVFTSTRLQRGGEGDELQKLRNGYNAVNSGDIIIGVAPGWKLSNEETGESFFSKMSYVQFPIIFYGAGVKARHITTPVTTDRIAPTIAKSIHIRAPNACALQPLF